MKRIWLTGASSGIGAAMADILLSQGHFLAVSARNVQALEKLHREYPQQVLLLPGDLTDPREVRAMGERIEHVWGHLDQAILNAGTCEYLDVSAFEANMVERVMRANVFSAAYCVEAALPLLRKAGSAANPARIINIGSVAGHWPYPGGHVYGATKAFVEQFGYNLRCDLLGTGVRVTDIAPGMAETEFTLVRTKGDQDASDRLYRGTTPLTAEDIAEQIFYVATLPDHININRLEIMPSRQAWSPFAVDRD